MKLIIKLLMTALIANAAFRVGSAYATYYKFKDAVQQSTQYGTERTDRELRDRILELAAQYDVPLEEDGFTVAREENHTIVDGAFSVPIEVFPGVRRDWPFTFHTDAFVVRVQKP